MVSKELKFSKYDRIIFGLFLIMIGCIPIIINMKVVDYVSPIISKVNLIRTNSSIDTFSYYKFIALIVFTSMVLFVFILKCFKGYRVKQDLITYLLLIFAVIVLLAALLSNTTYTALIGQFNRFEGAISYIMYVILAVVAMNISYPKKMYRLITIAFIPVVVVNFILVTLILFNIKLFDYTWFQQLLSIFMNSEATLTERSLLMGTLNQWNNTSGFFACLIAYFITCFVIDNKTNFKWIYFVLAIAAFVVLVGNISTFAFYCVAFFFMIVTIASAYYKQWKNVLYLACYGVAALTITILMSFSTTLLWDDVLGGRIWDESFGNSGILLKHIDENRATLQITEENSTRLPKQVTVKFTEDPYLKQQQFTLPILPEEGNSALSSRIYIWKQTLSLLAEKPLLGYGMDTLLFNFPHFNIEARSGISTENLITDKPHSLYVGLLYGTGLIGFGLIFFTAVLVIRKIMLAAKCDSIKSLFPLLALIAVYCLQAVLYDSVVGSTFIIFIMVGIMISKLGTTIEA